MRSLIVYLLLLLLVGCGYFGKKHTMEGEAISNTDTIPSDEFIDQEFIKFVIDPKGTYYKSAPNENAKNKGLAKYATSLYIEGEEGDYYKVKHMESYNYVLKSKIGNWYEIYLLPSELRIIDYLTTDPGGDTNYFSEEENVELKDFVDIELIDKSLYDNAKKDAVDVLVKDTLDIYYVIDKKTGDVLSVLDSPCISPDKKHIIRIDATPYWVENTEFTLYAIGEGNSITQIFSTAFRYWLPCNREEKDAFWSTDGYFYVPVNHRVKYWKEYGNYNGKYQYIRIKIKD